MQFFLDTASPNQVRELIPIGIIDGITTNPSLVAAQSQGFVEVIRELCTLVDGPVSAEVPSTDYDSMLSEGRYLAKIADNVIVKLPITLEGLKACHVLTGEGIGVNMTLCFSAAQALLAAKAGALFVSPFIGRLDDIGHNGIDLIRDIRNIYNQGGVDTQILAASLRHPLHVTQVAEAGADAATIPPKIIYQLLHHPLTDKGIATFTEDWAKSKKTITA